MFVVTIDNAQNVEEMRFHIDDPMLKYCQSTSNSCCTLTIFKHWIINAKPHFLYVLGIVDCNYKHFKCVFTLCFIIPLKYFLIETRFICAKLFFNPIKIKIEPTLWYRRLTLELEFILILIFIFILFSDLQILSTKHDHLCIRALFHHHLLQVIFDTCRYIKRHICIVFDLFFKSSGKMSVSSNN